MTASELRRVKDMWDMGLPVKQIAYEVGYSNQYIYTIARCNREQFPRRCRAHQSFDEGTKQMWARRVSSGESTIVNAANQCGVSRVTIRKWVRRYA